MNPYFFGTSTHRLFGVYSAARAQGASLSPRAAVLCNPWGPEYQYAHRSMRFLANELCDAGWHVLRFDYYGTGDSAGEAREVSLSDWAEDVGAAVDELRDSSGSAQIALVGLRLGGTLAAQVAHARPSDIPQLVLWEPILSGRAYLRDLRRNSGGSAGEIQGFPVSDALLRDLESLELAPCIDSYAGRTLLMVSDIEAVPLAKNRAVEQASSLAVWNPERGLGVGAIPIDVIRRIVAWMGT
jgi:pimeloyl-ACP methyl ester carboxylesterase